jgi:antitoxin HicB
MTKSAEYYLGLPYTIELHQDAEEGWFVRVKELPGCMSQGDTADDALASIREVMPLWIETALESGYEIPEPRAAEEYSGKFVVRVPRSLHRELVQGAVSEGVSLNQFINVVLSRAVGGALHSAQAGAPVDPAGMQQPPEKSPAARDSDRRSSRQPLGAPGLGA